MPGWCSGGLEAAHTVLGLQRNASGKVVRIGGIQRPWYLRRRHPSVQVAIDAVVQMEVAIGGALAGRRPDAASWGEISAPEFLTVAQDVTTFVLSRFDSGAQRPFCAIETFPYEDDTSRRCFARLRANLVDKPLRGKRS